MKLSTKGAPLARKINLSRSLGMRGLRPHVCICGNKLQSGLSLSFFSKYLNSSEPKDEGEKRLRLLGSADPGLASDVGQSFTDSTFGELSYAVNIQLIHNLSAVCLDSLYAYLKVAGDLFGGFAFSEKL